MSIDLPSHADDLAAVFCSSARQTLRTALGRSCSMAPGGRIPGAPATLPLGMRFDLVDGGEGSIGFLLQREAAAILADLMMMGDGSAPWNEEHKDALQELGNQLAGAFSTSQTERWAHRLHFKAHVVEDADPGSGAFYPVELDIQGFPLQSAILSVSEEMMGTISELDDQRASQSDFPRPDEFNEGISRDLGTASPASAQHPARGTASVEPTPALPPLPPAATAWIDSHDPSVKRLLDVPIDVTIELGQTELSIRRILEIGPGSIIELDRMAGEPVDLVVNDKVIARGEVVVIEENFGIRITGLVTPEERARPGR
jgi:flagellar motor switch protein FliN/FliY